MASQSTPHPSQLAPFLRLRPLKVLHSPSTGTARSPAKSPFPCARRPPPSTPSKRSSTAKSSANWRSPAAPAQAKPASPRNVTPEKKSAATILAPAAPARNTRNATASKNDPRYEEDRTKSAPSPPLHY